MRVLMLSWEFPPRSTGGIGAHVLGLAHALHVAGDEVVVMTRRAPGTDPDGELGGVRIIRVDVDLPWIDDHGITRTASANNAFSAAASILGEWRPDVIHGHDWGTAWACVTLSELFHVPLVTTFHGTERGRHGGHLPPGVPTDINSVEWWLATRSHRVIATTKLMVREIINGFEVHPETVTRVPTGIDPEWWRTVPDDDDGVDHPTRVLAWGRVRYEKGFQVLANAIALLRGRVDGLECTIAGRGSYLPELQSLIDIAGVGDLIELPGFLADNDLRAAIHHAGCVVIPSLYEPFGVVALEALAGGAPLIVADTGGLAEAVAGTGAALLFEPGNAEQLAAAIDQVLSDRELATSMVERGQELLAATYTWAAIANRTGDVYQQVVTAEPNRRP